MGLLDDAIRAHLELKRLHGADASEVIFQERDALGPVPREKAGAHAEPVANSREPPAARDGYPIGGKASMSVDPPPHLSQETVELDMRSVLGAEPNGDNSREGVDLWSPEVRATPARTRVARSSSEGGSTDDSLKWEVPGGHKHVNGRLQDEGFGPIHHVVDTRKAQAKDVLARAVGAGHDTPGPDDCAPTLMANRPYGPH
jgi:hypothetical protein